MVYKYISVKNVIESVYRDYDHSEELDIWDVVEWAGEALEFIGAGSQYIETLKDVCVSGHKACLPVDFHLLQQISYNGLPLTYASGTMEPATTNTIEDNSIKGTEVDNDNFPLLQDQKNLHVGHSYYINDDYLVTSFESGCVTMAYKAIAIDKDGFPKIPDLIAYRKAVSTYIQCMLDNREWRKGRLPSSVYQESKREWNRLCGQARGQALMPNIDKMESIKNQWVKLRPNMSSHRRFFNDLNTPERKNI